MREVNETNILNYQSDDSDIDDDQDSDDFEDNIKKQKEDLVANEAWG